MAAPSRTSPRILCAGIAVLDEVFRVKQVPPTDTKTDASAYVSVSGGCAANAAVAIARLGGRASFAGPLGDDDTADRILAGLARENIDCAGCVRVAGAASSVSAILINDAGERTIVDPYAIRSCSQRCRANAAGTRGGCRLRPGRQSPAEFCHADLRGGAATRPADCAGCRQADANSMIRCLRWQRTSFFLREV